MPCSTHTAFGHKRSWVVEFMIVYCVDQMRYSSDRAFCACHGRAVKTSPVVLRISFWGGLVPSHISFYRWLIWVKLRRSDTNVISASVAFQTSTTEAVLVRHVLMHAFIVLFGIWTFFLNLMPWCSWCESRSQTCTYIYIERERNR